MGSVGLFKIIGVLVVLIAGYVLFVSQVSANLYVCQNSLTMVSGGLLFYGMNPQQMVEYCQIGRLLYFGSWLALIAGGILIFSNNPSLSIICSIIGAVYLLSFFYITFGGDIINNISQSQQNPTKVTIDGSSSTPEMTITLADWSKEFGTITEQGKYVYLKGDSKDIGYRARISKNMSLADQDQVEIFWDNTNRYTVGYFGLNEGELAQTNEYMSLGVITYVDGSVITISHCGTNDNITIPLTINSWYQTNIQVDKTNKQSKISILDATGKLLKEVTLTNLECIANLNKIYLGTRGLDGTNYSMSGS